MNIYKNAIILGAECNRHKETTTAVWIACLQGKIIKYPQSI